MFRLTLLVVCVVSVISCRTSKPLPYLKGINLQDTMNVAYPEPRIQKGDVLFISILSDNPSATAIYNQAGGSAPAGGSSPESMGAASSGGNSYLVDYFGRIRLHELGLIDVEGLTINELNALITSKLTNIGTLKNPYAITKFTNQKYTVIGEVKSPGVFQMRRDRVTILEAMGEAGDVSNYGKKDDITVIREVNGKRTYGVVNLTDAKVMASPFFYIQPNDVVVVGVDERKSTATDEATLRYVTIGLSLISTIAIVVSLLR